MAITTSFSDASAKASSKSGKLLSFSSSALAGEKIAGAVRRAMASDRRSGRRCGGRIVSPKAVSDSSNSQTCLDPDASRVSGFDHPDAV